MLPLLTATLLCTGVAPTTPMTNVEFEIRPANVKYSTVRFEITEGSLAGTASIQSIGRMRGIQRGPLFIFSSGSGPLNTKLVVRVANDQIVESRMTHYSSSLKEAAVDCTVLSDNH